jgi:hypothetical protein
MINNNKLKAEVVAELYGSRNSPVCVNLVTLLDVMIAEKREENDTADTDGVKRNQGFVSAMKDLQAYITRGLPAFQDIERKKP